jgi:hypothetical protein
MTLKNNWFFVRLVSECEEEEEAIESQKKNNCFCQKKTLLL